MNETINIQFFNETSYPLIYQSLNYSTNLTFNKLENDANSYYNDYGYTFRYGITATLLLSIAYFIVFVIGIIGNIAVFIIVYKGPRMRTLTNQFISNLSIADLLVNCFCLPFTLAATLIPAWSLGTFFCKMVSYLQGVSVSASVNTLMAISIERCIAIACPLSATMSSKQYKLVVFCIWSVALIINLPWLYVFTLEPMGNGSNLQICIELWPSQRTENIYFILANLILCYLGPLSVISVCYIIIWRKVANRNVPGEYVKHKHMRDTINKSRLKVTKMVFVVIITFALSWLPLYTIFCIVKFWTVILENENARIIIYLILPVAQWLGASNSCINPILYAYMNRKFRNNFKKFFKKPCCLFGKLEQDDNKAFGNYRSDNYRLERRNTTNNLTRNKNTQPLNDINKNNTENNSENVNPNNNSNDNVNNNKNANNTDSSNNNNNSTKEISFNENS